MSSTLMDSMWDFVVFSVFTYRICWCGAEYKTLRAVSETTIRR